MLLGFFFMIIVLIVCVSNSSFLNNNLVTEHLDNVPEGMSDDNLSKLNPDVHQLVQHSESSNPTSLEEVPDGFPSESVNPEAEEKFTTDIPSCLPKDQLMPQELLPQDTESNQWNLANPQGSGSLKDKNFLQAGYHVGINTVGQTLRNANMQLRSDPPNPQLQVSPWLQTTINPDVNRKPFEIGGEA